MIDIFNRKSLLLSKEALDQNLARLNLISQNIANSETPNYKSQDISSFQSNLEESLASHLPMKTTDPSHMTDSASSTSKYQIIRDESSPRLDNNSVDVDNELVKLSNISTLYNAIITARMKLSSIMKGLVENG
ncbi:MAG: flagellar basal body rod protein FlgB [Nitrospinota bacterium]